MAWLTAPRVGTAGSEPENGLTVVVPNAGKLVQGPLDTRHWISPLDTNEIIGVKSPHSYAFTS